MGSKVKNYLNKLTTLMAELDKLENQHHHKIKEITNDAKDNIVFLVELYGKETPIHCYPFELARHDEILEGFDKPDVKTIVYHATKEAHKPSIKIIAQEMDVSSETMLFKLLDKETGKHLRKRAMEISNEGGFIKKMSPKDAHSIGYASCVESLEQEAREIRAILGREK